MKTLDKSTFDATRTQSYKAAYFDEINRKWVMYDKSYVSLLDTTLYFETNHLTKIRTVQDQGKFDRVWEKYNIRVYFKENDEAYIDSYKSAKESWHESGAPIMVQDVAHYLAEVMIKFTKSGLPVPQTFSVYIQEMDDDGVVGILGMKNGLKRGVPSPCAKFTTSSVKVFNPPIPEPQITPIRFVSRLGKSKPASLIASSEAAIA